jgi:hypothetical protein
MVNGVRKPDGSATVLPSAETASTLGAPILTVIGPVTLSDCCVPGFSVPANDVAPVVELVASIQQDPDVAAKVNVKVAPDTSYVAALTVLDWGKKTGGGRVVVDELTVGLPVDFEGGDVDVTPRPVDRAWWRAWAGTVCDPVNSSTTTRTMTTATAAAGAAKRRGRRLIHPRALSRLAGESCDGVDGVDATGRSVSSKVAGISVLSAGGGGTGGRADGGATVIRTEGVPPRRMALSG